jgi:PEP-CTERM motif
LPHRAPAGRGFEIFQEGGEMSRKLLNLDLDLDPDKDALVLRYEFYKFNGEYGLEGEALCGDGGGQGRGRGGAGGGGVLPEACGGLGAYAGRQMVGFNAVQPPMAPVPEPASLALMLAGLLGVTAQVGRRRRHER